MHRLVAHTRISFIGSGAVILAVKLDVLFMNAAVDIGVGMLTTAGSVDIAGVEDGIIMNSYSSSKREIGCYGGLIIGGPLRSCGGLSPSNMAMCPGLGAGIDNAAAKRGGNLTVMAGTVGLNVAGTAGGRDGACCGLRS